MQASGLYQAFPVFLSHYMLRDTRWDGRLGAGETSETASDNVYVHLGRGPFINGTSPVWLLMIRVISKA